MVSFSKLFYDKIMGLAFISATSYYPSRGVRLVLSFLTGSFITVLGENVHEINLHPRRFLIAEAGSFCIAACLSELIHYTSFSLNEKYSWKLDFNSRLLWQGIIYPIIHTVAAILLAEMYFWFLETSIFKQGYFVYDFPMVICFLIIVNLYYVIADFAVIKMPRRKKLPNHKPPPLPLTGPNVPAMFFSEGKANFVISFNGECVGWVKTLRETIEELPPEFYFQINKGHIIHRELISHYEEHTSLRLIVYFHEPIAKNPGIVVQRNVKDFKDWYEGDQ